MTLSTRSKKNIWHPFSQMGIGQIIGIASAQGAELTDEQGNVYIDAISSWWTNTHGHAHPYIAEKVYRQAQTLEHVIFSGFTHKPAVELAERLLSHWNGHFSRVFFSDNGSTSVEVAIKMAFQYWYNQRNEKRKIIAFNESYHGDTFGAMSVSARNAFTEPFFPYLFDVEYVESPAIDAEKCIEEIKEKTKHGDVAAIIFEPLVQGAGGMLMYEPSVLEYLISYCREKNILTIADEVMTGFGRTGKRFGTDYSTCKPDLITMSKGLTGGTMALGITACTSDIFDAFLSEDFMHKTFFHGHSFTANPLACASALASLDLLEQQETTDSIQRISKQHKQFAKRIESSPLVENVRHIGTIVALDIITKEKTAYENPIRDILYSFFLQKGILLRPLGNTIYVLPPYCVTDQQLQTIYQAIEECLEMLHDQSIFHK